jgi:hypothetical protein
LWQDQAWLKAWWQKRFYDHHKAKGKHLKALPMNEDRYTRPLPSLADEALSAQAQAQAPGLSRANARRLIEQYGAAAVERGLNLMRGRHNITNPAGFIITLLRSEHKFLSKSKELPRPAVKTFVSNADWKEQIKQSAYLSFLANADEFLDLSET